MLFPSRETTDVDTVMDEITPPAVVSFPTSAVGVRPRCNGPDPIPDPIPCKSVLLRSDNCAAGVSASLGQVL